MVDDNVLRELRAAVEGDMSFVRDLVDAYVSDSAGLLDAIEEALANNDAEALVRPSHTLKSSSATLGAMDLSATARTLEMAARSGTLGADETRTAGERIRAEWDAASEGLWEWLTRAEPA